ncbi:hypothetical protein ACFY2W_28640 [Streptomyces sp. NPDC001262]|uniref:hypothetical protein n=1 Tax=unclassified Streptomyces TaxID=2593676 RepID=UPI0036951443
MRLLNCPTATATGPCVTLTLHDGAERLYLLDEPDGRPATAGARHAVYDPYVHLAYLLARQGHDARWLARFTDLPLAATHHIADAAALSRA